MIGILLVYHLPSCPTFSLSELMGLISGVAVEVVVPITAGGLHVEYRGVGAAQNFMAHGNHGPVPEDFDPNAQERTTLYCLP